MQFYYKYILFLKRHVRVILDLELAHLTTDALENSPTDFNKTLAPTDIKLNGAIVHLLSLSQQYRSSVYCIK